VPQAANEATPCTRGQRGRRREGLIRGQNSVADGRETGSESEQESTLSSIFQLVIRPTNRGFGETICRVKAAALRPTNGPRGQSGGRLERR
jgi:hypothetical protein